MQEGKKIPEQSGGTDIPRDEASKPNGATFYFWKWLGETHPVIDFIVWLLVLGMSVTAFFVSVVSMIR